MLPAVHQTPSGKKM